MTEKRFKAKLDECGVYHYVCENGEILAETYGKDDAEDIAKRLNELFDEIEQLKQTINELNIPIDEIKETVTDWKGRTVGVYYNDRE